MLRVMITMTLTVITKVMLKLKLMAMIVMDPVFTSDDAGDCFKNKNRNYNYIYNNPNDNDDDNKTTITTLNIMKIAGIFKITAIHTIMKISF